MEFSIQETEKKNIAQYKHEGLVRISTVSAFLDIMMNAPCETIALKREAFSEEFFDLRTGWAGEILQKVSNYKKRLIILGDYANESSKSLRDFIYESNKTGKVLFVGGLEEAVKLLR